MYLSSLLLVGFSFLFYPGSRNKGAGYSDISICLLHSIPLSQYLSRVLDRRLDYLHRNSYSKEGILSEKEKANNKWESNQLEHIDNWIMRHQYPAGKCPYLGYSLCPPNAPLSKNVIQHLDVK